MEKDSTSVISIESDEEMDTVAEPEAPSSSLNEKKTENEVPNDVENASNTPKSPANNATNDESAKEYDVICLDDDEKEPTESCEEKSAESLSASEMNVAKPPSESMENEDTKMMEITQDAEDKNCQKTDPPPEQKVVEPNVVESNIISVDDEEVPTDSCNEKSAESLSAIAASAAETNVPKPPTAKMKMDDTKMMEITQDAEVKNCQQIDPPPEQKMEEMKDVQPKAMLDIDKTEPTIDSADHPSDETEKPQLSNANDSEQDLVNRKRGIQKCSNTSCAKKDFTFIDAPVFAQNLYKMPPNKQAKLICSDCFEFSVIHYESLCTSLVKEESLYKKELLQDKIEEIHTVLDSSDEESDETAESEPNVVEPALPEDAQSLINTNLNDIVESLWQKFGETHLSLYNADMLREARENEEKSKRIDEQLKTLKTELQSIHENIYSVRTTKIDQEELIIEDDAMSERIAYLRLLRMLNANEPLVREPVKVNETYYGVCTSILTSWVKCKVLELCENHVYTVRFTTGQMQQSVLTAKHLAYTVAPQVKLRLGTRIIAKVSSGVGDEASRSFYAGTVLESISAYNKFRYLIIFDSGHTLYAPLSDVRVVCEQSNNIWDDVHPHSKEFIRNYMLTCGSMRPMVQAHRGQRMSVEINQKWYQGKVLETDSSLFRLYFQELDKYEWIYRGSKRLGPLYSKGMPNNKFSKFQRRNEPSIEYITIEDDENEQPEEKGPSHSMKNEPQDTQNRPTARKSTMQRLNNNKTTNNNDNSSSNGNNNNNARVISLNQKPIYIDMDKDRSHGKTLTFNTDKYRGPQRFVTHRCNPNCLYKMPSNIHTYNLLARPLVTGWERHICYMRGTKKASVIMYRAPCGRRLRDMQEVHRYLRLTNCSLNVEHFDFETDVRALATFKAENFLFECKDLSFGVEVMPVHCVNNYDNMQPPPCEYSTERKTTPGVTLTLDKEFLCGCDCEDDCLDKSKCQCWQLTIQGVRYTTPYVDINNVGYVYKRLMDQIHTGIYECNEQCKCKKDKCLNRVVQHPLQMKLEVFNTNNKGWGIRCINDVPKGSFICIYAGELLTDDYSTFLCETDENKTGDEYFADLDYIETAIKTKENYESEAYQSAGEENPPSDESEIELEKEKFESAQDSDEEYTSKTVPSAMAVKTRAQSKKASTTERSAKAPIIGVNDEQECVNLIPNPEMKPADKSGPNSESAFRKLYGDNQDIFIMDAKKQGNLGRYFNNVFVDTHDLRFPWVAFFASKNIKAGTELTWNYNYDVGSVNGKVLNCTCGEKVCKGRLL
uniref:Histone-lysine N-methyltransferase eggless n=1 Tax=Anopheles funestus TaxID=62324 RepID=A0A182RJ96_ANOFN